MATHLSGGAAEPIMPWIVQGEQLSDLAAAWYDEALRMQQTLASALAEAWAQTGVLLASSGSPHRMSANMDLAARASDTARATAFRLAEACAMAQEHVYRVARNAGIVPALLPAWLPRVTVLSTVALDLLTSYAALDGRAYWRSDAVTAEERLALHERGAARLMEAIN